MSSKRVSGSSVRKPLRACAGVTRVVDAGGVLGHTYALIADGAESLLDILTSLLVWAGFRVAARPPDADHPYGHGKIEFVSAGFEGGLILAAAAVIGALRSVIMAAARAVHMRCGGRSFDGNPDGLATGRWRMVVIVAVRMVMPMATCSVSAPFRFEGLVGLTHRQVHGAQHVGQHMVGLNLEVVRL